MSQKTIVQSTYQAQFLDPIAFVQGEQVQLQQRDTQWPEFIWAIDIRGRSGWVHDSFIDVTAFPTISVRDYDARELSVEVGDEVEIIESLGGWHWCQNKFGIRGWIPDAAINQTRQGH